MATARIWARIKNNDMNACVCVCVHSVEKGEIPTKQEKD